MARYQQVCWNQTPVYIENLAYSLYNRETGFTVYCADHLRSLGIDKEWHHSANENRGSGIHGIRAGRMAKRMGQQAGFPDFICCRSRVAIELKVLTQPEPNTPLRDQAYKKLSKDQEYWLQHLKDCGWRVYVLWNFQQFKTIIERVTQDSGSKPP